MKSNFLLLFSFVLQPLFTFFTTTIFVELILFLFNIKNYRKRASIRLLPFVVTPIDLILYHYSLFNWLNPLYCNSCTQKILLEFFFKDLQSYLIENDLSFMNYLAHTAGLNSELIFLSFFVLTIGCVAIWAIRTLFSFFRWKSYVNKTDTCRRKPSSSILGRLLAKNHVQTLATSEIITPAALNRSTIILPYGLINSLSDSEFEAVVAHELEHLQKNDPFSRLYIDLFEAIFWWIPSKWWKSKVLLEQELACDAAVQSYGLDAKALALSFIKAKKFTQNRVFAENCALIDAKTDLVIRVNALLGQPPCVSDTNVYRLAWLALEFLVISLCFILAK